jgi:hypothetical protein
MKKVSRSKAKGKKYKVVVNGKTINFGAKGYKIKPGTSAGDSYCARSAGIKGTNDKTSANYWARQLWSCKGNKSVSKKPFFGKRNLP